jgi:hypothetical protein
LPADQEKWLRQKGPSLMKLRRVRVLLPLCVLALLALPCSAQESQHWTERRNLGFRGSVRSVLTSVNRPNLDPRPTGKHKLFVEEHPDRVTFDAQGRRIEFASGYSSDHVEVMSKCEFRGDGTEVCEDSTDRETRRRETTLPDASREVAYFLGSEMQRREVTSFDEKGRAIASHIYDGSGRLTSEDSTQFSDDGETSTWKIYNEKGDVVLNTRTHVPKDKTRFDRWSYDSVGGVVWNLALNGDGELLSYSYNVGYKPRLSSSGSLGICRPELCVDYKFDEEGSGRMEKLVQHTSGEGNLEPDSEEHYDLDGVLDERAEIKYARDANGNWTSRSVFVWDPTSNQMIEIERDTRTIEYY